MTQYEPTNQYRCTIIRGKSQSEMEDLLPFYAQVVHKNCPCTKEDFDVRCNNQLASFLFRVNDFEKLPDDNKKTIRNHITEVMGKLLGLYYTDEEGYVCESSSCTHLYNNHDFPTFFKNICFNLQFPNGAASTKYIKQYMGDKLNFRPLCFVVSLLQYARNNGNVLLTKQEIGYYVLNNLEVLQGKVSEKEVYDRIILDRQNEIKRPSLSGSRDWQHIKEMFNLLNLANVALTDNTYIWLNKNEEQAIEIFCKNTTPAFNIYEYNADTTEGAKELKEAWQRYYSSMNKDIANLETQFGKTESDREQVRQRGAVGLSTVELGDQGEALIYQMEKERVRQFKERLVNKVLLLGKTKGLGYDISSLEADENPIHPEFARYIEVKSTKRVTKPSFAENWSDTLNLTTKEWVAAEQYGAYYNIYRVYFTRDEVIVVRVKDPFKLSQEGVIDVFPTIYQMDFGKDAIVKQYKTEGYI